MIMGNGIQNNTIKKSYENNDNAINNKSPFVKEPTILDHVQHSNVLDKNEMREKAVNMLQERYSNGSITLEEFNKQCKKLSNDFKN